MASINPKVFLNNGPGGLDELNALMDSITAEESVSEKKPDIKVEDGEGSPIDFNTLGSVLARPLTPNSIAPSAISEPAIGSTHSSSNDTEIPDRFVNNAPVHPPPAQPAPAQQAAHYQHQQAAHPEYHQGAEVGYVQAPAGFLYENHHHGDFYHNPAQVYVVGFEEAGIHPAQGYYPFAEPGAGHGNGAQHQAVFFGHPGAQEPYLGPEHHQHHLGQGQEGGVGIAQGLQLPAIPAFQAVVGGPFSQPTLQQLQDSYNRGEIGQYAPGPSIRALQEQAAADGVQLGDQFNPGAVQAPAAIPADQPARIPPGSIRLSPTPSVRGRHENIPEIFATGEFKPPEGLTAQASFLWKELFRRHQQFSLAVSKDDLNAYKEALFWSKTAWAALYRELKDHKKISVEVKTWGKEEAEAWKPIQWDDKKIGKLSPSEKSTNSSNPRKRQASPAAGPSNFNKRLAQKAKALVQARLLVTEMVQEDERKKKKFFKPRKNISGNDTNGEESGSS